VSDDPISFEEASTWLVSHPLRDVSKFHRQALKLGPRVIPAMVRVLADGPLEHRAGAGLVLAVNGVEITTQGDTDEDFTFLLTMPDGSHQAVRPANNEPTLLSPETSNETKPTLDQAGLHRMFLRYAILL
jgi:hypothetical protein